MPAYEHIITERTGPVLRVWLNRPEMRNAFNPRLISELTECFNGVEGDPSIRAVILGGRGPFFCAGADLNWMAEMAHYTPEQNRADAMQLAQMLEAVDACPVMVVGMVQCGAYGGALGLMACCDMVVCDMEARFAFSETRLGLAPATIAPYVLAKIGLSHARSLLLAGQGFDAPHAQQIGLVHRLVPVESLEQAAQAMAQNLLLAGPVAVKETKMLLRDLAGAMSEQVQERTANLIAALRVSEEGQEGLDSFIMKRQPRWQEDHTLGAPTKRI